MDVKSNLSHRPRTAERSFASAIVMNVEFSGVRNIISLLALRFSLAAIFRVFETRYKGEKRRKTIAFLGIASGLVTGAILERYNSAGH